MICQACGAYADEDARFCPYCGEPLEYEEPEDEMPEDGEPEDLSTPWRHDPGNEEKGHSLLYKITAAITGVLLVTAVVAVILAWRLTGGI
ncbi:MAG: zinc ribbon domain-containing protein [Oscillospiraceae bacterium]|nr:zinc ribbon domain-containing protein [Oscillospiraceae bacterium]